MFSAIAAAVALAAAATPKFVDMHPGKAHDEKAAAWFLEDPRRNVWCAFTSRTARDAMGKKLGDANLEQNPTYAWLMLDRGSIASITIETQSEDAFTDDRYQFDRGGQVNELARTGHYINDAWTTFYYRPDGKGHVDLPREGRAIAHNLERNKSFTTYWLDWSTYSRLSELPFASLITLEGDKVTVKTGCTAPAKAQNKRR